MAQVRSLEDEFDSLQEAKDAELERLEQEVREASEEIQSLRLDSEEAAALHENEVAGLQEEICRLKAELERVQRVNGEYRLEITSLQAEISMKQAGTGDGQPPPDLTVVTHYEQRDAASSESMAGLQEELQSWRDRYQELKEEYQILQESNKSMIHRLEKVEALKYRSRSKTGDVPLVESDSEEYAERQFHSGKRVSLAGAGSICFKLSEDVGIGTEFEECNRMSLVEEVEERTSDLQLQLQLEAEEEKMEAVQAECNQAQDKLREMESKYQVSLEEWEQLQEELRLCKEEIERLNGTIPVGGRIQLVSHVGLKPFNKFRVRWGIFKTDKGSFKVPVGGLKPVALFVALAGGLFLYPCLKRYCGSSPST